MAPAGSAVHRKNELPCFLRPPLTHSPLQRAKLIVGRRTGVLDLKMGQRASAFSSGFSSNQAIIMGQVFSKGSLRVRQ